MNRILKSIFFLIFGVAFVSCNKDDKAEDVYVIPYAEQYPKDIAAIEKFLGEYYMEVSSDFDVTFTKIPDGNPDNKVSIMDQTDYPLLNKNVLSNGVNYKVYYINITKTAANSSDPDYFGANESPSKVDSVFVSYKGRLLDNTSFDESNTPVWFEMTRTIEGWGEVLSEFKTGNHVYDDLTGVVTFSDFGAGIMFLPSGLGYYNNSSVSISAYSPLIFNFKLKKLNYVDHDYDRIDSRFEINVGADGKFADTDGDGYPDYLDQDDDNDGYSTKNEIKKPGGGYYTYDEISDCDGNLSNPLRVRRYLDKSCHN